jgi:hypothetical protein
MARFSVAVLAVAAVLAMQTAAFAKDESCPKDTLLSLVDTALKGQPSIPRLAARRYGARATFLKIRYEQLGENQAGMLLNGLVDASIQGADELALAWSIHTLGNHEALAKLTKDRPGALTVSLPTSALRALLLTDNGPDILIERIAITPKERLGAITNAIMTAVIDQPDALKEKIVAAAEKRNVPEISNLIAAHLVATETKPDAWTAFAARHAADSDINDLTRKVSWLPGLVGNPALKVPGSTPEADASRAQLNTILNAGALQPELDFLGTYMNQTGLLRETAAAADVVIKAVADGKIRRNGTLDATWPLVYRELIKAVGDKAKVDSVLDAIQVQTGRPIGNGRATMRDVLDRLLVVEALQPYVTARTKPMPSPPVELSEKMKGDWANWAGMATIIRGGTISPGLAVDPALFGIVTELLFAKADYPALTAFIGQAPAGEAQVATSTDFAVRLDRACASYLSHPAEAVLLSGQPI